MSTKNPRKSQWFLNILSNPANAATPPFRILRKNYLINVRQSVRYVHSCPHRVTLMKMSTKNPSQWFLNIMSNPANAANLNSWLCLTEESRTSDSKLFAGSLSIWNILEFSPKLKFFFWKNIPNVHSHSPVCRMSTQSYRK